MSRITQNTDIKLRPEQQDAIARTFAYWQNCSNPKRREFLWNAKPRFGKTLAAYQFAHKISAQRILIITNRPATADSWAYDFYRYIEPHSNHIFIAAKSHDVRIGEEVYHVRSRAEMINSNADLNRPLYYFISLQDIKGKSADTDDFKVKNQWIFNIEKKWDLLIIDESHEGVKTIKTESVLKNLNVDFILHLSGTPFRALADQDFTRQQIFNWTYIDEQKAKASYTGKSPNPYIDLPRLNFYSYHLETIMSPYLGLEVNYDLDEFFRTRNGSFVHHQNVKKWLDLTSKIIQRFHHTFWIMSKVDDCKAMKTLLKSHPVFKDYEVILAAGKGDNEHSGRHILEKVRSAIGTKPLHSKTITLSCGQLTTGITIPEWTAVLMLYNTSDIAKTSSTQYLQAAFRAQTPWTYQKFKKRECYIFDFAADRTLNILQDYAINLCQKTTQDNSNEQALSELLKYLTVISMDENGSLRKLSPQDILDLPRKLIGKEVVDGRFITSNKLFDTSSIFHSSPNTLSIVNKIQAIKKHGPERPIHQLPTPTTRLDQNGDIVPNSESITKTFREVINRKKYAKLNLQPTPKFQNLAALESELRAAEMQDAEKLLAREMLQEIKQEIHSAAEKQKKSEEEAYRDKLRGLARAVPILLHVYGRQGITLNRLQQKVNDAIFEELTGITKADFYTLRQADLFREDNFNAAIQEFMQREIKFSDYYKDDIEESIFDCIPSQRDNKIFTPKQVVSQMLDALELQDSNIFKSPHHKFLDLYAKSGLFISGIIERLYKNLRPQFNSEQACLSHILTQQVYTWSPNKLWQKSTINTILSFVRFKTITFDTEARRRLTKNLLEFYPFQQKGKKRMKFDVIIGNPPYQNGRRQVYADFYKLAVDLNPELLCMIFPLGWQKPNSYNGLGQLNNQRYKRDPHIVSIDNYYEEGGSKIFPDVGTGGINIVLRNKNHDNGGEIQKLEYGRAAGKIILPINPSEVTKPPELESLHPFVSNMPKIDSLGSSRKPYGFCAEPLKHPKKYDLDLYDQKQQASDVRLVGLLPNGSRGYKYISRTKLPRISPRLDTYKIFVPKAWGNMSKTVGLGGSYSNICIAAPGDACSETFIEFGPFQNQTDAIKIAKYFMTKFFRALLFLAKDSQNTAKDKYRYIPLPNLTENIWQASIAELDELLFNLYQFPESSRQFIRENIQARSETNIEVL